MLEGVHRRQKRGTRSGFSVELDPGFISVAIPILLHLFTCIDVGINDGRTPHLRFHSKYFMFHLLLYYILFHGVYIYIYIIYIYIVAIIYLYIFLRQSSMMQDMMVIHLEVINLLHLAGQCTFGEILNFIG